MTQVTEMTRLFLEFDGDYWLFRSHKPLWDDSVEIARIEAKRHQTLFPQLGKAIIMRSNIGQGKWHIRFPDAKLTKEQEHVLQVESKSHRGYVYFCEEVGDSTLRVSTKNKGKTMAPYLVEIIEVGN